MYQACAALWHDLSDAEKQDWQTLAASKHMTGFALWQSSCLKPNPGIYLPLQGGSMTGDIEMNKNRILELPLPVDVQEPLTIEYYNTIIEPQLPKEGARAHQNANFNIPHNTHVYLPFNSEQWDTDNMHSPTVQAERFTCNTAGVYAIIAYLWWDINAVGAREAKLQINRGTYIAYALQNAAIAIQTYQIVSTQWDMNVGDFVELRVRQFSGAGLNIITGFATSPEFMIQRIRV